MITTSCLPIYKHSCCSKNSLAFSASDDRYSLLSAADPIPRLIPTTLPSVVRFPISHHIFSDFSPLWKLLSAESAMLTQFHVYNKQPFRCPLSVFQRLITFVWLFPTVHFRITRLHLTTVIFWPIFRSHMPPILSAQVVLKQLQQKYISTFPGESIPSYPR